MAENVHVSVRELVEFILRSGDIGTLSGNMPETEAMQLGSQVHRRLQQMAGPSYRAEVSLSHTTVIDETLSITVSGRADGIFSESELAADENGVLEMRELVTIDEIKGTLRNVRRMSAPVPVHLAQAKCYAHFYACDHGLSRICVQMTYAGLRKDQVRRFTEQYEAAVLADWYEDVILRYSKWILWKRAWTARRDASILQGHFPYAYRDSQKKLVSGIYQTILRKKRLFIQAPTGTGKTLAAIYPAIQAMGGGLSDKIFYLTARTIARTVAEESFKTLEDTGFEIKRITLTAKEKLCVLDEPLCSPQYCPRAAGHFDRINEAMMDMITHETAMDRACVLAYAEKHQVCPFELQLDVSLWIDAIICDYNYVFDPDVALKRYFEGKGGSYLLLIDEAHNLVDRAREMYSAQMTLSELTLARERLRGLDRKLSERLGKCITSLKNLKDSSDKRCEVTGQAGVLITHLNRVTAAIEELFKKELTLTQRKELLDLYFPVRNMISAYDRQDGERYLTYLLRDGEELTVRIFCIDPSGDLGERLDKARSSLFFSATLIPVDYYKQMLSPTAGEDYDLYVTSPFDPRRRLLMMAGDVSSRYTLRGPELYEKYAGYIRRIIRGRHGNYMIFFPSYRLMEDVFEAFTDRELARAGHGLRVVRQQPGMDEDSRQAFLEEFEAGAAESTIGFCVMGGIFSEGIDLKEDRLIGAIIVGTGLPQVGEERELIKGFFDARGENGFDYAYLYPGMNKVLQAAGRVIRTEKDCGIIALLDERFAYSSYRRLFPAEWSDCRRTDLSRAEQLVEDFWTGIEPEMIGAAGKAAGTAAATAKKEIGIAGAAGAEPETAEAAEKENGISGKSRPKSIEAYQLYLPPDSQ